MKTSKNNLNDIYNEFGTQICLYPFLNGLYQTNHVDPELARANSIRPCSVILDQDLDAWNIKTTIAEARNNDKWKTCRRAFIEQDSSAVPACSACTYNESNGATSARQLNNQFYVEHLSVDIIDEVRQVIANDYVSNKIVTMDYYPSNYCNYACIMCAGGASSGRHTFELKYLGLKRNIILNEPNTDFYDLVKDLEVINLTGGETILQKQVEDLMDYLIAHDLAQNIIITLITNASSYPTKLMEKFKQFKDVFYTISIDGIGDIIEYQRRGANWQEVANNSVRIYNNFGSIINCVLTAVNVFGIVDTLNWLKENNMDKICISPVFRELHLSADAIPVEIKLPLINKIEAARAQETNPKFIEYYNQVLGVLTGTEFNPLTLEKFVRRIRIEDQVSKKKLADVVPEWAPYFE